MTENELFNMCIPQIAEIALEIQKMTPEQYGEFKRQHLEEVSRTCPKALGFIKKILDTVEWCLDE